VNRLGIIFAFVIDIIVTAIDADVLIFVAKIMLSARVLFIISDHGYGHASRCAALIEQMRCDVFVASGVPTAFFEESLLDPLAEAAFRIANPNQTDVLGTLLPHIRFLHTQTDVGVNQLDSIRVDVDGTLTRLDTFWSAFDAKVDLIVEAARSFAPTVVVFDISALGPVVAKRLGVPSVGISNFSW
jgi:hypothetical protein